MLGVEERCVKTAGIDAEQRATVAFLAGSGALFGLQVARFAVDFVHGMFEKLRS